MIVYRQDAIRIGKACTRADGSRDIPATLAKPGVLTYVHADGSVTRELRAPQAVFDAAAMATFEGVPVVDEHPPSGRVTPANFRTLARGSLRSVREDGGALAGMVTVYDEELIRKIDAGKTQVSLGYTCDVRREDGVFEGQAYDHVQGPPIGNHVAITDRARGGPAMRLHLDSEGAVMADPETTDVRFSFGIDEGRLTTMKIGRHELKLDGLKAEHEAAITAAVTAHEADLAKVRTDSAAEGERKLAELQARLDSANAELAPLKAAQTDAAKAKAAAEEQARIEARVQTRLALVRRCDALGVKVDDATDDEGLMLAAIKQVRGDSFAVPAGVDRATYLRATFDGLQPVNSAEALLRAAQGGGTRGDSALADADRYDPVNIARRRAADLFPQAQGAATASR